jgi:DNA polymerase-3 subunit beta
MTTFAVTGHDLHDAAVWAARATPAKPTAPVLSGLLLEASDTGELVITGYDFETRASVTIAATVTKPGRMLMSARLLAAIAKTVARDVDVVIEETGGAAEIRCGRSEWTVPLLPVADYPRLPDLGEPVGLVSAGELRRALGRVLPAVGKDRTLEVLTGVRIETDGDQLQLIGTDRYRLAVATIPWQPAGNSPVNALVPGALLDTAVRATGGDTDMVSIASSETGFGLSTDSSLITGRQLAAEYLRWRQFIQMPGGDRHAVVDVASLVRAVEQARVAMTEAPQLLLAFTDDEVDVSATGGDARAHAVASAKLVGEPITVTVNAGYLRDALDAHDGDSVTLHFGASANKPMLVLGADPDTYQHVMMPIRSAK